MKKLDVLTPVGIIVGIIMMLAAVYFNDAGTGRLDDFIKMAPVLIVTGGLVSAILINFSMEDLRSVPKTVKEAFQNNQQDTKETIDSFLEMAELARREGLLSIESEVDEMRDPFLQKGMRLAIDGEDPEIIKDILTADIAAMKSRHTESREILEKAGEYAPAWGMIGTLVGLVLMLQNLDDPSSLGPSMAIALLTTLYGSLLANLIFLPMANKLKSNTKKEVYFKQITVEGLIGVQSGQSPKKLRDKLYAFLPKAISEADNEESKGKEQTLEGDLGAG
ncbi:MotA/TolQ/ExbB proton channel family protein [Evansella clarkii]|uniref:MotA/TolQ/ExbB proton channel family protein n=1 Tax=Evansella clarkii TaxID=79879 RepID=UPI0009985AE3|nr:MotA/TolQ/ExbB proton channel family protein [Evansella clarkii]